MKRKRRLLGICALLIAVWLPPAAWADGELEPGFAPRLFKTGWVKAIVVQADEKILIGGLFKTVNGVPRPGLARLNPDGSLDSSFDASEVISNLKLDGEGITALAQQPDGHILAAGVFSDDRYRLVRLNANGSLDSTFVPYNDPNAPLNPANFKMQPDGKILLSAGLTRIVRLNTNGSLDWQAAVPSPDFGGVSFSGFSLLFQPDGKVLVSGFVGNLIGTTVRLLFRLNADGTTDSSFNPSHTIVTMASLLAVQPDGKILSTLGSSDRLVRLNADGSLDLSFVATINGTVQVVLPQPDGRIVAVLASTTNTGTQQYSLARFNPDGSSDNTLTNTIINRPFSILARQADGKLLAGGVFYLTGNEVHAGLARFQADGRVDSDFQTMVGERAAVQYASSSPGNRIVIAGDFDLVNGTPRPKLARLDADGALDDSFVPQIESRVRGGEFSKLAVQPDGKVLVYSQSRNNFLRLLDDGREDGSFSLLSSISFIGADGLIALQADGKILLPNTLARNPASFLNRLNPDGLIDSSFNPPDGLRVMSGIALQPDGKIVLAGSISLAGVPGQAILRLNTDGTQQALFNASFFPETFIRALALQPDGKILLGGDALGPDANRQRFVVRLTSEGVLDPSFNTVWLGSTSTNLPFEIIKTLAVQPEGKVLVASTGRNDVVRLNSNGSVDRSFSFNVALFNNQAGASINVLLLQSDGRLLVGGAFDRAGPASGSERFSLAKIRLGAASVATTVSAASFAAAVAPESIVSIFGVGLAATTIAANAQPLPGSLDNVVVKFRDGAGVVRSAPLLFISPQQINCLVPAGTVAALAQVTVEFDGQALASGTPSVKTVAPGFFTFNSNGRGVPAGYALRVRGGLQTREAIHQIGATNQFEPRPIDLSLPEDQVWLVLFGTGIRARLALSNVTATIGGVNALVGYAGAQGDFAGLDQVNLLIPRSLAGRGEVDVVLVVNDGSENQTARSVKINLR